MVDDHDVVQGNLWGHSGAAAPKGDLQAGGYVKAASFINMLQRIQTGHNPDAFDPTPVLQGITVYYAAFRYGGVSFAILEDRKFKGGDADGTRATDRLSRRRRRCSAPGRSSSSPAGRADAGCRRSA